MSAQLRLVERGRIVNNAFVRDLATHLKEIDRMFDAGMIAEARNKLKRLLSLMPDEVSHALV